MSKEEYCKMFNFELLSQLEDNSLQVKDKVSGREMNVPCYIWQQSEIEITEPSDAVNHPKHYNRPGKKECIDEMVDIYGLKETCLWSLVTAYKYSYRAGEKRGNSKEQDHKKIRWYLKWFRDHVKNLKDYEKMFIVSYYYKTLVKISENTGVIFKEDDDDGNHEDL